MLGTELVLVQLHQLRTKVCNHTHILLLLPLCILTRRWAYVGIVEMAVLNQKACFCYNFLAQAQISMTFWSSIHSLSSILYLKLTAPCYWLNIVQFVITTQSQNVFGCCQPRTQEVIPH